MSAGLQVFAGDGSVTFDTNDYVGRFLGSVAAGLGAGSIVDANLANGIPFAVPILDLPSTGDWLKDFGAYVTGPTINFSGTTMSFSRPAGPTDMAYPACTIYYGIR